MVLGTEYLNLWFVIDSGAGNDEFSVLFGQKTRDFEVDFGAGNAEFSVLFGENKRDFGIGKGASIPWVGSVCCLVVVDFYLWHYHLQKKVF